MLSSISSQLDSLNQHNLYNGNYKYTHFHFTFRNSYIIFDVIDYSIRRHIYRITTVRLNMTVAGLVVLKLRFIVQLHMLLHNPYNTMKLRTTNHSPYQSTYIIFPSSQKNVLALSLNENSCN